MGVQDKTTALFGECKWTNEKVDLAVLEKLIERSELFNYKNKHFYLFAKSGFTKGCIRKAEEMGNVRLVEYSEMLKEVNKMADIKLFNINKTVKEYQSGTVTLVTM